MLLAIATVPAWVAIFALLNPEGARATVHATRVAIGTAVAQGARGWLCWRVTWLARDVADEFKWQQRRERERERLARLNARRDPG